MAKETVTIGCRLLHGLIIRHPADQSITAEIKGVRDSNIIGATFMTTDIDAELWTSWRLAYPNYQPLESGAIFEARNTTEATAKAKELRNEKTGFEPLDPKSMGVKPADKD